MSDSSEPIRILRGPGGEVEVRGPVDGFAATVLRRAGFLFEPSLRGHWIRLPFDMGCEWENAQASWAAEMLTAARYPTHLHPGLQPAGSNAAPSAPRPSPAMTAQAPPAGRRPRR